VLIDDGRALPNKQSRAVLDEFGDVLTSKITALVHEGDGFKAAIVRSIAASRSLLKGCSSRVKVFSSVLDAIAWLKVKLPDTGADLDSCVPAFRRELSESEESDSSAA